MSLAVTEDRIRRLVDSGLRGTCRPTERISQLKKRVKEMDTARSGRIEQMFFGLADKTRLMIMKLLSYGELCACEITAALDLTQSTTSHHLGILERTGLITPRREGKWIFYRLTDPKAVALIMKGSRSLAEGV